MTKWINDLHAAIDDIPILLLSQRFRMFLHEVLTSFKVDKCIIRDALRDDEAQILNRLQSVLLSESGRKEVLSLENENAEWFLVLLQDVTDSFPIDDELRRVVHRLSINLSQASEKLPTSLLLSGVFTSSHRQVGGGGFADIFIGEYVHQTVALKRLRIFEGPQEKVRIKKMFFREALIWHRLRHPRVLPFLGIDAESFAPYICIVAPWIANRDVMAYMRRNGLGSLDTHRVLTEVSEGLQYLHKQNVVHGDLRGGNIFLDGSCHVLLADFGLSNFADATQITTTHHRDGSMRWMSPELHFPNKFGMSFQRTFASDVYAFGCVCLEVLTGERPFSDVPSDAEFLMAVLISQPPTRPDLGEPVRQMVLDKIWPIILQCLTQCPKDRPSTLSEHGSLPELVMTASVATAVLEVKNPMVTGGIDGSIPIITTSSEQPTGGDVLSCFGFPEPDDFTSLKPDFTFPEPEGFTFPAHEGFTLIPPEEVTLPAPGQFTYNVPEEFTFPSLGEFMFPAPEEFTLPAPGQFPNHVPEEFSFLVPQQFTYNAPREFTLPAPDTSPLPRLDRRRDLLPVVSFSPPDPPSHPILGPRRWRSSPAGSYQGRRSSDKIKAEIGETLIPGLSSVNLLDRIVPSVPSVSSISTNVAGSNDRDKGQPEKKRWCCDTCGASFSQENDLVDHRLTHAKPEGKPFPCYKCDKTFLRKNYLKRHVRKVHRDSAATSVIGRRLFPFC
ncbi:hypothetical protein JAAARDRAFT_39594 [Jaapia argillacea MUCL 33604]|uniref:Uncharacterized protein n=1 Tax=Jaapia argillacea MUCL 33604 TaxID=933084 RepID=A0A067PE76_9AGAM|nr:hypothetical protein JAAARDRAFT_39594 [Jaapia argillacea MUCL 33604]